MDGQTECIIEQMFNIHIKELKTNMIKKIKISKLLYK